MTKYFAPLGVFAGGMITTLVAWLFLGTIGSGVDQLETDSAAIASTFWNWSWVCQSEVVRAFIVVVMLLLTLYATAKTFVAVK